MSAEPIMEPIMEPVVPKPQPQMDPIDLLEAFEKAAGAMPIRAEFIEGTGIVPPQPEHRHNAGIVKLIVQFHLAGFDLAGVNDGFRVAKADGTTMALVVPDFYVCRREPTELDESYRKAHRGWYPIDLLALVGEVTSTNHEMDTGPKHRAYAAAGIPVYVLIDRHAKTAHCYTDPVLPEKPDEDDEGDDPVEAYYSSDTKVTLGDPLPLPAPYPALDTAPFVKS
ncbi:Uma2 family endonuclease [Streptomyces lavenduligriseus]|uniref:Uma2 family endonuclease n=1 Tax=Streptomyces lavenduligriseus TaxID=67315 RepID=A0ABT0P409_9ACTN|nr:Uma2 family endonuclease [Streptomyces lavenduligriseus]MCL3998490.1 Uma2 family endonuclease [Streptomyces lavenduligriseus]